VKEQLLISNRSFQRFEIRKYLSAMIWVTKNIR